MSKPDISTPNPYLPSYFDPETYSTVQPGTHLDAFNRLHNEPKSEEDQDANLALPRYGIFLLVFVPLMILCLAVTVYYLNRNRRNGMKHATSPIELESQQADRRYPTPTPSLPELYWPNAFHLNGSPTPSDPDDNAHHRGRPHRSPQPPLRPRSRSSNLDKSLPALPRDRAGDDGDEWETVRDNDTFADAFAQHRRDREAQRSNNHRGGGVNDAFAAHRRRLQDQLDFADTDIIASSDTYTMGPPSSSGGGGGFGYLSRPPPPPRPPRRNPDRESRTKDGYVPARDLLGGRRRVAEAPPSSSGVFPSSLDEMSMWPETELTNDPYKEAVARNRREGR